MYVFYVVFNKKRYKYREKGKRVCSADCKPIKKVWESVIISRRAMYARKVWGCVIKERREWMLDNS